MYLRRHVAYLVEEEGAPTGELGRVAGRRRSTTPVSSFLVAEESESSRVSEQGGAVDAHARGLRRLPVKWM